MVSSCAEQKVDTVTNQYETDPWTQTDQHTIETHLMQTSLFEHVEELYTATIHTCPVASDGPPPHCIGPQTPKEPSTSKTG